MKNELYDQLTASAQEMGVSRGELIAQSFKEWLERNKPHDETK
jgi:hypothetical protein